MPCTKCKTGITVSMRVETAITGFYCKEQGVKTVTTHFEAPLKNVLR